MSSYWTNAEKPSVYWQSLGGMQTMALILAYLELLLKGLIVAYLGYDYENKNPGQLSNLFDNFLRRVMEFHLCEELD